MNGIDVAEWKQERKEVFIIRREEISGIKAEGQEGTMVESGRRERPGGSGKIEQYEPAEIERKSFEIISRELAERGISLPASLEMVTKRVIHTTADFDYARTMTCSEGAVEIAVGLLLRGADIVTDTGMAFAGINKRTLAKFGGEAHCFMADEDVAELAGRRGITRAAVSMEKAGQLAARRKKPVIVAVGNAPTALIRLYELIREGSFRPAFVIGVPVGFVNVEAAKELIVETDVPHIVNRGRKGGSSIAAAICNALLYEAARMCEE